MTLTHLADLEVSLPLNLGTVSLGVNAYAYKRCRGQVTGVLPSSERILICVLKSLGEINFSLYHVKIDHIFLLVLI